MFKRILFLLCSLWHVIGTFAAGDNRVLLWIGDEKITANEFAYYYGKYAESCDTPVSVEAYCERFIDFKLKAADARMHGWDTLPDFRRYGEMLQRKALESCLMQLSQIDSCYVAWRRSSVKYVPADGWVKMRSITFPLSSSATTKEETDAFCFMKTVSDSLKQGASFDSLALRYGIEREKHQVGKALSWRSVDEMLQEFSDNLSRLEVGQISEPFVSPLGIHVIQLVGRKDSLSETEMYALFPFCMERQKMAFFRDDAPDVKQFIGSYSGSFRQKEMEEGLLVAHWDAEESERLSQPVPSEYLKKYFNEHKKEYVWEFPHFKGGIIHCLSKRNASKIKKKLRKLPMEEWQDLLESLAENDETYRCEVEIGLFRIGENPYVDKLAFKCGELPDGGKFPYSFVLGKRLNKAPETYTDVLEQVTADYRLAQSWERLKQLRGKIGVKIDESVLKTVNCSGNK